MNLVVFRSGRACLFAVLLISTSACTTQPDADAGFLNELLDAIARGITGAIANLAEAITLTVLL